VYLAVQGETIVDQGAVLEADPTNAVLVEVIAIDAVVETVIDVMVAAGTRTATTIVTKLSVGTAALAVVVVRNAMSVPILGRVLDQIQLAVGHARDPHELIDVTIVVTTVVAEIAKTVAEETVAVEIAAETAGAEIVAETARAAEETGEITVVGRTTKMTGLTIRKMVLLTTNTIAVSNATETWMKEDQLSETVQEPTPKLVIITLKSNTLNQFKTETPPISKVPYKGPKILKSI
jgi:hypothetical protein